jgi:uncharacterized protein Yka (UPF0111/DUF47 family)
MPYTTHLVDLIQEIQEQLETRNTTAYKEDAWDAMSVVCDKVGSLVHEYDALVRELADGIPQDSNCPVCTEELDNHEESCALFRSQILLKRTGR